MACRGLGFGSQSISMKLSWPDIGENSKILHVCDDMGIFQHSTYHVKKYDFYELRILTDLNLKVKQDDYYRRVWC
jgi:hypothetical protein